MFRSIVGTNRCIIPADGFYEWKVIDPNKKTKQPMYVQLQDTRLFGFAGIYTPPTKTHPAGTAAIITTTPNELMKPIHNRMPAILLPALEDVWLDPEDDRHSRSAHHADALPGRIHAGNPRLNEGELGKRSGAGADPAGHLGVIAEFRRPVPSIFLHRRMTRFRDEGRFARVCPILGMTPPEDPRPQHAPTSGLSVPLRIRQRVGDRRPGRSSCPDDPDVTRRNDILIGQRAPQD
jgi:hypothetical protein